MQKHPPPLKQLDNLQAIGHNLFMNKPTIDLCHSALSEKVVQELYKSEGQKEKGLRFSSKPLYLRVVGHEGLEPSTNGLRVRCSTN